MELLYNKPFPSNQYGELHTFAVFIYCSDEYRKYTYMLNFFVQKVGRWNFAYKLNNFIRGHSVSRFFADPDYFTWGFSCVEIH